MSWLLSASAQGILWGIMVLGVYITYKLLDIADLTVDGSFTLGGCVCAVMILNYHVDPVPALVIGALAGALAGAVTGLLHTLFEIPPILAGILTQIGLWSVNLRVMGMKNNLAVEQENTVFYRLLNLFNGNQNVSFLVIGIVAAVLIVAALYWFFGTEIGSALRATGNNEDMIRALGVNTNMTKLLALVLSNGLVGLSGGLICQMQKYADINMGTGAIIIGLAAIVIGDVLLGWARSFASKLTSAVLGAIVYFVIRALVLRLGMNANYMKLLSAVMVALALCIPVIVRKWKLRQSYSEEGETEC